VPKEPGDVFSDDVFPAVIDGLRRGLRATGRDLAIFLQEPNDDNLRSLGRIAARGLFDGLIISETSEDDPRIDYLLKQQKPFVAFGRSRLQQKFAWVDPDFEAATTQAVTRLCGDGHRHIVLLLTNSPRYCSVLTERAFVAAMAAFGLPRLPDSVLRLAPGEVGGAAVDAVLDHDRQPTAIVVNDALLAAGLYRRLSDRGLAPGTDISIVGVLPDSRAQLLLPKLAAFQTDWNAAGEKLAVAMDTELARAVSASPLGTGGQGPARTGPKLSRSIIPVIFEPGGSLKPVRPRQ